MLIADSHEFIELYRGDKDFRLGQEMVRLDPNLRFVSFAPRAISPAERELIDAPHLDRSMLPPLPERMEVHLLRSIAFKFAYKEVGGIVSFMPGYARALRRSAPDAILENPYTWLTPRSYATAAVAKRLGVPVIYHDPGDDVPVSRKQRMLVPFETPVVNRAAAIITYNAIGQCRFVEKYGYAADKIHIVPKPVDVARWHRPDLREETRAALGIAPGTFVVAHSGRLTQMRGSAMLAEAARSAIRDPRFTDVLFLFIGGFLHSDANQDDYEGANTMITGMVDNDQVPALLSAADAVVFPDLATHAGFTTAIAEAMAAAKPIIVGMDPAHGAVPIRHQETGVVITPRSVTSLLEAVALLKAEPDYARRLGRAVGKYASVNMDYPSVARQYLDIVKGAIFNAASL